MLTTAVPTGWVTVARETFEPSLVPWLGCTYAPWLRACARPHPADPRGQVPVPERVAAAKEALRKGRVPAQRQAGPDRRCGLSRRCRRELALGRGRRCSRRPRCRRCA
jgi:hypothetical protein